MKLDKNLSYVAIIVAFIFLVKTVLGVSRGLNITNVAGDIVVAIGLLVLGIYLVKDVASADETEPPKEIQH